MINEKAKDYADLVSDDEDNYLKIYHAYEDGWRDSEPEKGANSYIIQGIFLGFFFGMFVFALLIQFNIVKLK